MAGREEIGWEWEFADQLMVVRPQFVMEQVVENLVEVKAGELVEVLIEVLVEGLVLLERCKHLCST